MSRAQTPIIEPWELGRKWRIHFQPDGLGRPEEHDHQLSLGLCAAAEMGAAQQKLQLPKKIAPPLMQQQTSYSPQENSPAAGWTGGNIRKQHLEVWNKEARVVWCCHQTAERWRGIHRRELVCSTPYDNYVHPLLCILCSSATWHCSRLL